MKENHDANYVKLNAEQKEVYQSVIDSVEHDKGGLFLFIEVEVVVKPFCGKQIVVICVPNIK